jgi:hypothetical protein
MNGNIHVQFLGEGVAVTPPPYPAPGGVIPQGDPALYRALDTFSGPVPGGPARPSERVV